MPRYYKEKIYTDEQRQKISEALQTKLQRTNEQTHRQWLDYKEAVRHQNAIQHSKTIKNDKL